MRDLSGTWNGIFNYPADDPAVAFVAVLRDDGGALAGTIEEPATHLPGTPAIEAAIEGRREGNAVRFVKFYQDNPGGYDTVSYAGTLAEDGHEITGRWDIPGVWSGTFLMVREAGVAPAEELEAQTEAEAPGPEPSTTPTPQKA